MSKTLISAIDVASGVAILRAVDYLRVSTEEQKKGYGISYTGKRTARHIGAKGWQHVGTYADEGFSGSLDHTQRPDLKKLMEAARQTPRPFDVVVVAEERAIGRRDRAFWPWVWQLEDLGIFVSIVKGDYDNTTEAGRSRMRKEADRAEDERVTIRDRTQGGRQEKAEFGGHIGGPAPYGYRIEDKGKVGESRLVLDTGDGDESFPMLRRMFTLLVEQGKNPSEVEDLFNIEGKCGPQLEYWRRGSVRQVLTTRAVQEARVIFRDPNSPRTRMDASGKPTFGDTVEIKLDPVFSDVELKLLNLALERTSRGPRTAENNVHPLSGHVIGLCEAHFTGVSNTGRAGKRVYRCTGKSHEKDKGGVRQKCDCAQIDAETLESRVWSAICEMLEDPDRLNQMAGDWADMVKSSDVDYGARIQELGEQIEELEAAIEATEASAARRAARKKMDKKAIAEAVERASFSLTEELDSLEKLRSEARAWQSEAQGTLARARDLEALAVVARTKIHNMDVLQQEDIIDLLDLRVTILGEVPRATRHDDGITKWFRERDRVVPVLTDAAWALVEPIYNARRGRKPKDPRALLDAVLLKARTGCPWKDVPYGDVASIWQRWVKSGLWEELMEALAGVPGKPVREHVVLPPLRIEGRVDPRLLISEDRELDQDDVFKSSDYKISPFELESALLEHEAVAEAAVVPAPDPLRLAVPKAYIVLAEGWEPGPGTAKALFAHSRATLAPYKRVRRLEFAELPKTVSGKIRRIELRERTARGGGDEYREEDHR